MRADTSLKVGKGTRLCTKRHACGPPLAMNLCTPFCRSELGADKRLCVCGRVRLYIFLDKPPKKYNYVFPTLAPISCAISLHERASPHEFSWPSAWCVLGARFRGTTLRTIMQSKLPKTAPPSEDHIWCKDHGDYVPRGARVCQGPGSSHIKPKVLKYMRISLPDVLILCNQYQFASTLVLKEDASQIAEANNDKKTPDVWRCKNCNKLRSRIMRMQESHGRLVAGFSNLGQDEREKFNCEAATLFKEDLRKKLTEVIVWTSYKKQRIGFEADGDYQPERIIRDRHAKEEAH